MTKHYRVKDASNRDDVKLSWRYEWENEEYWRRRRGEKDLESYNQRFIDRWEEFGEIELM